MTCPTSPTWLTGTSCSTLPASSPGLPPQPAGTEAFKLVLQKVRVQSCCTGRVYYQPNPTVSSTDVCTVLPTSFSSERNGLPLRTLLPTFILILLHSIERVGGSLKDKYRALFWNMCSVLRVRIAVLQYCSTCCPVVIGVLYTVSSFVRYSLCLWRGLPPFVPTKDYYLGRYSRVTCSLGSFTVHSVQPRTQVGTSTASPFGTSLTR